MKSHVLIFLLLSLPGLVRAGFGLQTDLELKIQEKVRSIIAPVDPSAIVVAQVTFKKLEAQLPGTGLSYHGAFTPETMGQVSSHDIQNITVKIISGMDTIPESLRQAVKSSIGIDSNLITFKFEPMSKDVKDLVRAQKVDGLKQWLEPLVQNFVEQLQSVVQGLWFFIKVFGISFLFMLGGGFFWTSQTAKRQRQVLEEAAGRVAQGLENSGLGGGGAGRAAFLPAGPAASTGPERLTAPASSHQQDQIGELPRASVLALFSDCYWCEEDGYASWLWNRFSTAQRESLLQDWPRALEYSRSLTRVPEDAKNEHLQPCYLNPVDLKGVSQADIAIWLKEEPSAWTMISPMRQRTLKIPLREKMRLSVQKSVPSVHKMPESSLQARRLETFVELGQISEVDELGLLEQPETIPWEVREQIQTLVWAVLLPLDEQRGIFDSMSAQDIAEAWIGPEQVLKGLAAAIPEKKMKLVEGYRTAVRPSRSSPTMKWISQRALEILKKTEGLKETPADSAA